MRKESATNSATFLAFDFGMKRIGVAVGQSLTATANPLPYLKARDGIPHWEEIQTLINEWRPSALIVGIPLNMDGSEQQLTFCARKFSSRLKQKFHLPVHGVDERLSTIEARSQLFEKSGYKSLKKGYVDSIAAKLILEDWLSRNYFLKNR